MEPSIKALVPLVPPLYNRLLSLFPQKYFRFCFAYGSGVKKQAGKKTSKPMIDLIFVVDDPIGFHGQNVLMNPSHYSWLKYLGHNAITAVQRWPADVYFNTLVPIKEENVMLKYGVISKTDFINDLLDWNYLYLSGRLHKPVEIIHHPTGSDFTTALRINLLNALHSAFLLLPQYFTERHLYKTISSLSYNGDFRMIFGEDKNKIKNIVDAQIPSFRNLYKPLLKTLEDYVEIPDDESVDQTCMQDTSPFTRMFHLYQLPKVPQQRLVKHWRSVVHRRNQDTEEVLRSIAYYPDASSMLASCLRDIVFLSSAQQSAKGILTAGVLKSIIYSSKKIKKMMISTRQASS